ncbi:MAG: nitronate monooxygenase [Pseudomonadota bacterium]
MHPFTAAGMAFAGEKPEFVAAVSNAGGIGALGVGFIPAEALRERLQKIRSLTAKPFNVNFITCFDNDEQIRMVAEEKPPIVSFHWGHPSSEHMKLLLDAGISVWEQVGRIEDARRALGNGVEVIIAQGYEAGGHNYQSLPTMALVPEMVDALDGAMVLASGGISDGRGIAASLALGADGVWVGTRLLAAEEAYVHPEHVRRVIEASGEDTRFSRIFGPEMPHFNPMRLLRNRVVDAYSDRLEDVPMDRSDLDVIGDTIFLGAPETMRKFNVILPTPETRADWEEVPFLAGQGVGQVRKVQPAADIVADMMDEAAAIVGRLSTGVVRAVD